jgi:hypothetical protein
LVKFGKVLCQHCNNTRTQPFDLAYDRFSAWVNGKGEALLMQEQLDFAEIYGPDFQTSVLNLLKYFVKHLGCRLLSEGQAVPPGLGASLAKDDLAPFEISLARNAELAGGPFRGSGALHNFPTTCMLSPATMVAHEPYLSGMIVGYLDVVYRYGYRSRFAWEGDPVNPKIAKVRLGKFLHGMPHPTTGQIPDADRTIQIGGRTFEVPLLQIDHIKEIVALTAPMPDMSLIEKIEAKLKIAHVVLSHFYPDVTIEFLDENLALPDADKLFNLVLHRPD